MELRLRFTDLGLNGLLDWFTSGVWTVYSLVFLQQGLPGDQFWATLSHAKKDILKTAQAWDSIGRVNQPQTTFKEDDWDHKSDGFGPGKWLHTHTDFKMCSLYSWQPLGTT